MELGTQISMPSHDGRTLDGMAYGPADGEPLLFIAGAATGKAMRFGEDLLADTNTLLLTMSRPGMAGSDTAPGRTLASTSADYRAFVEALLGESGTPIPVVANSQGAVFGLRAALDGWVSRLVLVSPADEIADPRIRALLPPEATQLSDLACHDPADASTLLRGFSAEAMEEMVLAGADPSDRAVYRHPPFQRLYREALRQGFANDGAGYVADTLIAMRPWGLALEAIDVPVTVLFGERDTGHSPDHGGILTDRIPGARRRVLPDAGGALLWTHSAEVLAVAKGATA